MYCFLHSAWMVLYHCSDTNLVVRFNNKSREKQKQKYIQLKIIIITMNQKLF